MSDNTKSVFISYRRSNSKYAAKLIFDALQARGYSAFIDIESIDSGKFDRIILNQIAARAHFVLILSPGSLNRINTPNDWLRREIEQAIELNRNIVPLFMDGFNFDKEEIELPENLQSLPKFNGLTLHYEYFDEGIDRLCRRFLKQPLYGKIIPAPEEEQKIVNDKIRKASLDTSTAEFKPEKTQKKTSLKFWGILISVIVSLVIVCLLLLSVMFKNLLPQTINMNSPTATVLMPSNTLSPSPTIEPTKTMTPGPSQTPSPTNPIIESIDLPSNIMCDGRRYVFNINFHDINGDANSIKWELLYSKKNTPLTSVPREFEMSSSSQINGAVFEDWIEWYISGDDVRIRVTITDKTGLSGSKDFSFTCSN